MKLKITDIPHGAIRAKPEGDNPNELSDLQMKALRHTIETTGFVQPCLVRPVEVDSANPQIEYELIDGEHRWLILGELGAETVPCVVDTKADDTEALLRTLTMNGQRGELVPIKTAHMLADLADRIDEVELRKKLGLEPGELRNYLDLAGYLNEEPNPPVSPKAAEPLPGIEIAVVATHEQASKINARLIELTGGDEDREGAVVARKAREFDERRQA